MKATDWLAAQADPEFIPAPFAGMPADAAALGSLALDADYQAFLGARNGLYAFARGLHIFGLDDAKPYHDARARNRGAWRGAYGPLLEGMAFFAEDVFGNAFGMRAGEAFSFDPETGKLEKVGAGFRGWADYLVGDLGYATGGGVAKAFAAANGPIAWDCRLSPIKPFVLGGEFALANLRALPWDKNSELRSEIYRKIKDLPEGAKVEIRS